jgi:uncharacterized protein (TIGR03067 family)
MPPRKSKADLDSLQGAWSIAALEMDGHMMAAEMLSAASIVVEGDRFQSLGMGAKYEGKVVVDSTAKPKAFDLVFTSGPEKGNRNLGIYELSGNTWKLCLATHGTVRPTKFKAIPGSGIVVQTLTRGAAKAKAPAKSEKTDAGSGPATALEGEWKMVSGFLQGKPMEAEAVEWGVRTWRGNRTVLKFGPETYIDATFTVDPEQSPHAIDFVHQKGMYAGKTQSGIVQLEGDTMKLCVAPPGKPRPSDFAEREQNTVTVWRRAAK